MTARAMQSVLNLVAQLVTHLVTHLPELPLMRQRRSRLRRNHFDPHLLG